MILARIGVIEIASNRYVVSTILKLLNLGTGTMELIFHCTETIDCERLRLNK